MERLPFNIHRYTSQNARVAAGRARNVNVLDGASKSSRILGYSFLKFCKLLTASSEGIKTSKVK